MVVVHNSRDLCIILWSELLHWERIMQLKSFYKSELSLNSRKHLHPCLTFLLGTETSLCLIGDSSKYPCNMSVMRSPPRRLFPLPNERWTMGTKNGSYSYNVCAKHLEGPKLPGAVISWVHLGAPFKSQVVLLYHLAEVKYSWWYTTQASGSC